LSDAGGPPRAVLDTDVIYSRVLHELIGRLASQERLLTLIWSDELLTEAERILTTRKQVSEQAAERWVGYVRQAFPDQCVQIEPLPAEVDLATLTTDPGDHHVCALAIAGRADLLLTFDHGYLSEPLAEHGVEVLTPDMFLNTILEENHEALLSAIQSQADVWGGGRPIGELLDAIGRAGATVFAGKARRLLDI
jgi:predicted nucleic acid-binding protein